MEQLSNFVKKNAVLLVAIIAAILSGSLVPPDKAYLEYIDYRTLSTLFCMLVIVTGFERIHFFQILARRIVSRFHNSRAAIIALVYITFIGSMIIANDMALITFLPLGFYVLHSTDQKKFMAFSFIMQNIAANLGGMLTPFRNPQNLFMYSYFHINPFEFMNIMFWPFIVSIILITICCIFIPKERLELKDDFNKSLHPKKALIYLILFVFFLAIIFRLIPYWYGLIVIIIVFLIVDKVTLIKVDYALLMTFFSFFIFSGNISRISVISKFISGLLLKNTLLTGIISCQFISNVPSAILLSRFTSNYPDLLVAVNIGGTGTLIASLASLITYKEYIKRNPGRQWYYIKMFSIFNFGFLTLLTLLSMLVF